MLLLRSVHTPGLRLSNVITHTKMMREPHAGVRSSTQQTLLTIVALLLVVNILLVSYWMQASPRHTLQQSTGAGTGHVQQVWADDRMKARRLPSSLSCVCRTLQAPACKPTWGKHPSHFFGVRCGR